MYGSTPRFLAQEPLSKAHNAQASSSPQSDFRDRAAGERAGRCGGEERDTSYPAPISPLLGFGPCPMQGGAIPRAAPAPLSVLARAAGAPHPLPAPSWPRKGTARASRGLPPHFSRSPRISSSSCSNRPGDRLEKKSSDSLQSDPRSLIGSRACPAPDPEARGARPPNAPLPEAGAEAVSAVPQSPPPQPSAAAALRWESGRGGWVEDATRDSRERKKRKQEPPPPLNGAFGASD